jgi:hypothetical protein
MLGTFGGYRLLATRALRLLISRAIVAAESAWSLEQTTAFHGQWKESPHIRPIVMPSLS